MATFSRRDAATTLKFVGAAPRREKFSTISTDIFHDKTNYYTS